LSDEEDEGEEEEEGGGGARHVNAVRERDGVRWTRKVV